MVGELAMERFRLVERLGAGGMGTVYRAVDVRLQREVALKEIHGADTGRVLREAKAAARLNHPSIVTLYEFGAQGDLAMLVSELAHGDPLDVLARDGEITDREVAWVGVEVCSALAHAHERGVIHRDVKPQNIVADLSIDPPHAKLMDFGIAAIAGEAPLTATGQVMGTLAYMSPEQAEGAVAGPPSDVYSLALTLFECWAGENPAAGATPAATARNIGSHLLSLRDLRPDLPELLVEAIDDCLAPDPLERPPLSELAAVLGRCAEELDGEHTVPARPHDVGARGRRDRPLLGLLAPIGLAAVLAALAIPAGLPGLALTLAVLILPAFLFVRPLWRAALPALAVPLGAVSLASAAPVLDASGSGGRERALTGALAWMWLAAGSLALGVGPAMPFADRAAGGWSHSVGASASGVLAPLLDPTCLAAMALFALAAWAIGPVVRARHLPLALVGALVWGAGVDAALRGLDLGAVTPSPLLPAAAAAGAAFIAARPGVRARETQAPALG